MEPPKSNVFVFSFMPNEKTFQMVLRMKSNPGALSSVLDLLSSRVDLISINAYNAYEKTAVCNGYARALSKEETATKLEQLIRKSGMVEEVVVGESDEGLLVDGLGSGLEDNLGRSRMLMTSVGLSRTFDRLVEVFGSGGKTILFEEGSALGRANATYARRLIGAELAKRKLKTIYSSSGATGLGKITFKDEPSLLDFELKVDDCFECSSYGKVRKSCDWIRGQLSGGLSTYLDTKLACEEVRCRFRGDPACEFHLKKVEPGA
jgi:predicted hydrocarbon binding protein